MPDANQADSSLKNNVASGASKGHSVPFVSCVENDDSMKTSTLQISGKTIDSSVLLQILGNDPCGHLVYYSAKSLSSQSPSPLTFIIETRYGVKAELNKDGTKVFRIMATKLNQRALSDVPHQGPETSVAESVPQLSNSQLTRKRYRYRVLPDWQTSYMWYDVTWPENPQDSPVVDFKDIEDRYPELYPSYKKWQDLQEKVFARQFSADSENGDGALTRAQLIAWEVDGFLILCWLALQDDVSAVEYKPADVAYHIERGNLEVQFRDFIRDRIHLT